MLVLQALHGLSLDQTEYLVGDRLSWMRFCGLGPGEAVPDANTLWDFREALIRAKALDGLFARLDRAISEAGYLPMSGQIVDATLVAAPRQRNTHEEKAAQKDTGTRWTVKFAKAKPTTDGKPQIDIAIPTFGYKAHISIDRRHGVIRRRIVTDAAAHDGTRLREGLIDPDNTASDVWADAAYRSQANEDHLAEIGKVSRIHRKKPQGTPQGKALSRRTARANAQKSAIRSRVEHPFAVLKGTMRLAIRTIGKCRTEAAITLAVMGYNMKRWCWLDRTSAFA
jgi:transposase, IS5 family